MAKSQGSLKYVLLFVAAIILIRIDIVVGLGEKAFGLFRKNEVRVRADDLGDATEIVRSEKNVTLTPRQKYLAFMDDFRVSPELVFRQQAMELFKANPQMFTDKLDKDLEARVYSWRDLSVQNAEELPLFLLDLYNILKGENKNIITRFFSVVMDLNFDMFIASYPRSKEVSCAPVTLIEEAVPAEERLPELFERLSIIEAYVAREGIPADRKLYAGICMNALKVFLEKEAPAGLPANPENSSVAPEEAPPEQLPEGTNP